MNVLWKKDWLPFLNKNRTLIILAIGVIVFVGMVNLIFPSQDEYYWIDGGWRFAHGIELQRWDLTYYDNHPGVSVMWIVSFVYWSGLVRTGISLFNARIVFFLIKLFLIIFISRFIQIRINRRVAVFTFFYLLINTYLGVGIRATWLDQLLGLIYPLVVFFWWEFLSLRKQKYLWFTGVALGFALLTKVIAVFLIPILVLISLRRVLRQKNVFLELIKVGVIAGITYIGLFPAAFIRPEITTHRFTAEPVAVAVGGSWGLKSLPYYPTQWFVTELSIGLSLILLAVICVDKLKTKQWKYASEFSFNLGISGVVYSLLLMLPGIVLVQSTNINTFFADRYLTPAIVLCSVFVFTELSMRLAIKYLWGIFLVMIGITVYKLYDLAFIQMTLQYLVSRIHL